VPGLLQQDARFAEAGNAKRALPVPGERSLRQQRVSPPSQPTIRKDRCAAFTPGSPSLRRQITAIPQSRIDGARPSRQPPGCAPAMELRKRTARETRPACAILQFRAADGVTVRRCPATPNANRTRSGSGCTQQLADPAIFPVLRRRARAAQPALSQLNGVKQVARTAVSVFLSRLPSLSRQAQKAVTAQEPDPAAQSGFTDFSAIPETNGKRCPGF